jgi:Ca2+-binding EF-hand superfamily protein
MKCVNTQKDGFVTSSEVQAFFRTFNIPDETADRIFDRLDTNRSGLIEYEQFKNFVEQRIKPKGKLFEATPCSTRTPSPATSRRSTPTPYDEIDRVRRNTPEPKELSRSEMQRKLSQAVQLIAEKANLRYPSFRELRQAFRWVDLSKDGKVTRAEVENFFRVFAVPIEIAEYLFVLLDGKGSDEIDHSDFVKIFGPAMGIGHTEPSHKKQVELPGNRDLEREVNEIVRVMESHMLKFSHPREALRSLDLSHDGRITRDELRTFFQRFGIEHESADHVFDHLLSKDDAHDNHETCRYVDFMNLFDPVMQPSHYEQGGVAQVSH